MLGDHRIYCGLWPFYGLPGKPVPSINVGLLWDLVAVVLATWLRRYLEKAYRCIFSIYIYIYIYMCIYTCTTDTVEMVAQW